MTVNVIDQTGAVTGKLDLPEVFATSVNRAVMHQALLRQLANARQGTHDTKGRGEVSGGGKKPWRQKGTGRARQGSTRAPHWRHGGIVHGPTPRSYDQAMPRKQRRLALRSALAVKAEDNHITVLSGFEADAPKTKMVREMLGKLEAGKRVLVVLGSHNEILERSARNLPEVRVVLASNLSVRDLLVSETVVMTKDAVEHCQEAWA